MIICRDAFDKQSYHIWPQIKKNFKSRHTQIDF